MSNTKLVSHLPISWATLYELAKVEPLHLDLRLNFPVALMLVWPDSGTRVHYAQRIAARHCR